MIRTRNRNLFFFILFFLLNDFQNNLCAQTVQWSQQITDDKKMQYLKIIGTDEAGFYMLLSNISFDDERDHAGFRSRKYSLEYFDRELHLIWNQPLASSVPDARIIGVQVLNNKILVISAL